MEMDSNSCLHIETNTTAVKWNFQAGSFKCQIEQNRKQAQVIVVINFLLASGDFCHLLINFANSLDPDQDRHHVGPDLDPIDLTL